MSHGGRGRHRHVAETYTVGDGSVESRGVFGGLWVLLFVSTFFVGGPWAGFHAVLLGGLGVVILLRPSQIKLPAVWWGLAIAFVLAGSTAASTQALGALTLTSGGGTLKVNAPGSGTNAVTFTSLATVPVGSILNVVSPANTSVTMTGTTNTNGVIGSATGSSGHLYYNGADFAASTAGVIGAASYTSTGASLTAGNTTPYQITGSFSQTSSITANVGMKFTSAETLTINNGILLTLNNGANTSGAILVTGGSAVTIANEATATGLTTAGSRDLVLRTDTSSDSLTINVPITITTTGGLTKSGAGSVTLGVANAYTGATTINEGTWILGNATAMSGSTATVQVGGVLDLNGQTTTNAVILNGTGISSGGALINNTGTAQVGAITIGTGSGVVSTGAAIGASIGGTGNITSTGALSGANLLVKVGSGTLTLGTASTRVVGGNTRIDEGTLRLQATTNITPIGTANKILNGGTLSLGFNAANNAISGSNIVTANSTIITDRMNSGAGLTHTLGLLSIGAQTLTVKTGAGINTASAQGLTFGVTTLTGNSIFDVQSSSTQAGSSTLLTLGALNDQGVAKTITFINTGTSVTNSQVTLATAMQSMVDGTAVTLNNGTNAGVTLNLNTSSLVLGTMAQLTVNGNSIVNLGIAQQVASLAGSGNVTGAFVLTVGNANSTATANTTYSGSLGVGGVATALTKLGNGTLTLSGTNAYTGATIVSGGVLKLNNAAALGATSGVTINTSGAVDLAGQSTTRNFSGLNGAGMNGSGVVFNSSGSLGTITGTAVLTGNSTIGGNATVGQGNVLINNSTGLTGNFLLLKTGNGTLTIADSTTTSARTGVNQIDAGTLRIESSSGSSITPVGVGAFTMNGGTLSLGFNVSNNSNTGAVNLLTNTTIITDRQASGAGGITHTLGALTMGGQTLTVQAGSNFSGVTPTVGLTLGAVTIGGAALAPGNPIFDVQSTANAAMILTLATLSDQGIAPRTWTFQNSGAASGLTSQVTLGTAATSLVDGTIVNVNAGANAGIQLNLNLAAALGTLSRVTLTNNGSNVATLNLGAAQQIASLSGSGNVIGANILTVGNVNSSSVLSTDFTGVLGFGGVGTGLTKDGAGTLTLSGANAYTGATLVTRGTLKLNNAAALGTSSLVTVAATNAVLDLNGFSTSRAITLNGAGINGSGAMFNNTGTTSSLTGSVLLGAATTIGGSGDITVNNTVPMTGNFTLNKIGAGTLTFINNTTSARSGNNQINAGILQVQALTNIAPIGTGAFILNGGNLVIGNDAGYNQSNAVNVLANATITTDKYLTATGAITNTLSGAVTMGGQTLTVKAGSVVTAPTIGLTLGAVTIGGATLSPGNPVFDVQGTTTTATTLTLGALSDQGIAPRTITFQNSGVASSLASTVTLGTAAGSLVDGTIVNVNAGPNSGITLNSNNATALGALARVTLTNNGSNVATLNLGASQQIASLSGDGNITGSQNLTVGNVNSSSALNTTFSGVIGFGSVATSLTKDGFGTLTLTGNNTYTGTTTVTAGKLVINGNQTAATGATTVSGTGTRLGGSGTIGGDLTIESGAIHAVGNSPGLQTIRGATTYKTGSIFEWDLAANKDTASGGTRGTDYDAVNISGALTVQSGAIFKVIENAGVDFSDTFWDTSRTWSDIFSVTGAVTGWASNTAVDIYDTSGTLQDYSVEGSFTITGTTLSWNVIPEPSTALAGLLLAAGLLRRRRPAASVR